MEMSRKTVVKLCSSLLDGTGGLGRGFVLKLLVLFFCKKKRLLYLDFLGLVEGLSGWVAGVILSL